MIKYKNKALTAKEQPTCEGCPFDKTNGDKTKCRSKNYKGCTATYETK
jgi:hypothetical protein